MKPRDLQADMAMLREVLRLAEARDFGRAGALARTALAEGFEHPLLLNVVATTLEWVRSPFLYHQSTGVALAVAAFFGLAYLTIWSLGALTLAPKSADPEFRYMTTASPRRMRL